MNKGLKELKAKINMAIIQLGNELSTWVNCSSNISHEFKETIKNDYKRRLTAINNAINEVGKKELKALKIIKNKEINIHALLLHLKRFDSPEGFNALVGKKYKITQKEYDLLKEVLL